MPLPQICFQLGITISAAGPFGGVHILLLGLILNGERGGEGGGGGSQCAVVSMRNADLWALPGRCHKRSLFHSSTVFFVAQI